MGTTEDIIDVLDDYVYAYLRKNIISYALSLTSFAVTGFWGKIIAKVVGLFVDKIVIPAIRGLKDDALLFLRKEDLKKKLKKYLNSETEDEFDQNFDDLISGS